MTTFYFTDKQRKQIIQPPSPVSGTRKEQDVKKLWAKSQKDFQKLLGGLQRAQPSNVTYVGDPMFSTRYEEAEAFVQVYLSETAPETFDVQEQGIAAVMFGGFDYWRSRVRKGCMSSLFDLWYEVEGAAFVVQAMVESLRWRRYYDGAVYTLQRSISYDEKRVPSHGEEVPLVPGGWEDLREWLGTLEEDALSEAKAEAERLIQEKGVLARAALAYAFGEPEWARQVLAEMLGGEVKINYSTALKFCVLGLEGQDVDQLLEAYRVEIPVDQIYHLVSNYGEQAPRLIDALWTGRGFEIPRKGKSKSTPAKIKAEVIAAMGCVSCPGSARWLLEHSGDDEVWNAIDDYAQHSLGLLVLAMLDGAGGANGVSTIEKMWPRNPDQHEAVRGMLSQEQSAQLDACLAGELEVEEEIAEEEVVEEEVVAGTVQLQEIFSKGLEFREMYQECAKLIDSLEGDDQLRAIEVMYEQIKDTPMENVSHAHYSNWAWMARKGEEHPAQQLLLWGVFSSANSRTIKPLLSCTTYFKNVRYITLSGSYNKNIPKTMLKACAAATHFHQLHTLSISQNELDAKVGKAFAEGGLQSTVQHLDMTNTKCDSATFTAMFPPDAWPNLKKLSATSSGTSNKGNVLLETLSNSDVIELRALSINAPDVAVFEKFLESKAASKIEDLYLKFPVEQELLDVLAKSDLLSRLRTFGFYVSDEADLDFSVLWESGRCESLRSLTLHVTSLKMMRDVFESSKLSGLENLTLSNNWFKGESGESDAFIAKGNFPHLKTLGFAFDVSSSSIADVLCEGHYPELEYFSHSRAMSDDDVKRVISEHKTPNLKKMRGSFSSYTAQQQVDLGEVFGEEVFTL